MSVARENLKGMRGFILHKNPSNQNYNRSHGLYPGLLLNPTAESHQYFSTNYSRRKVQIKSRYFIGTIKIPIATNT